MKECQTGLDVINYNYMSVIFINVFKQSNSTYVEKTKEHFDCWAVIKDWQPHAKMNQQLLVFKLSAFYCIYFFKDPVEPIGNGENATVVEGGAKNFSCRVYGNPEPTIIWYKGIRGGGKIIYSGKEFEAREAGCYTCVAKNSLGSSVSITHCLKVNACKCACYTYLLKLKFLSNFSHSDFKGLEIVLGLIVCLLLLLYYFRDRLVKVTQRGPCC